MLPARGSRGELRVSGLAETEQPDSMGAGSISSPQGSKRRREDVLRNLFSESAGQGEGPGE